MKSKYKMANSKALLVISVCEQLPQESKIVEHCLSNITLDVHNANTNSLMRETIFKMEQQNIIPTASKNPHQFSKRRLLVYWNGFT